MISLNLGCGYDARSGYVNVDRRDLPGVNVRHDLNRYPWPFEDGCAIEILALDIFEHLDDVAAAMDECRRILVEGGRLTVKGPRPDTENLWLDVTHRRAFVEGSFDHFDWSTQMGQRHRYGSGTWRIATRYQEECNWVFVLVRMGDER